MDGRWLNCGPGETARRSAIDAAVLTLTTSAAMMGVSKAQASTPWAAINPICHMIDGDQREFGTGFNRRDSLVGLCLNCSAMLAWALVHNLAFPTVKGAAALAAGAATAAAAYVVDYHVVPKRFTPGFEKALSHGALFPIYLALGLTLGVIGLARGKVSGASGGSSAGRS